MSGLGRIGSGGVSGPGGVSEPDAPTPSQPATSEPSPGATTRSAGTRGAADVWATMASRASGTGSGAQGVAARTNLDPTGARRPVALGTNGRFTASPGTDAKKPAQVGAGLFAAAALIDDSKENLFDRMRPSADASRKIFSALRDDLGSVRPGRPAPAGLSQLQALQLRSSGTTVLLELMTAKNTPDAQKREAFALYRDLLGSETNPMLKDGMALHLTRLRDALPADLRPRVDEVGSVISPQKPPYGAWFKNGNDTVNVDWSAGSESLKDDVTGLKKKGFKVLSESYDKTVLEKTYVKNGVKTKFAVTIRPFQSNMYKNMADPKANMVIYTGHSNWGRNVRDSLAQVQGGAGAAGGKDKLVLTDLCVGKGEMQMFRDKFPDADLVTTFTSSYFVEGSEGEEPESEGIHAILNTFEGIASRKGYAAISEDVRKDNPWAEDHAAEGIDNNFIFPTDLATRRKVLDADHDGQADVFDRLIDFNTTAVKEDTAREFQTIEQPRPAGSIVGTKVHFAAQTVNRLTIYSEVHGKKNSNSKVVSGGYFEPKAGEKDLFRFEKSKAFGKDAVTMTMNARYAHMSEEALRMAACFEYNRFMAKERGFKLDGPETILSGMILASHSLDTDSGYRDDAVWGEFQKAYHLPSIPRSDVERFKEVDHEWYSGSYQSIRELKGTLSPQTLAALGGAGAGAGRI